MIRRVSLLLGFTFLFVLLVVGIVLAQTAGNNANATKTTATAVVTNTVASTETVAAPATTNKGLLSLAELPPYILLVGQRGAPDAKFIGFRWGLDDNGKPVYKLEGTDKDQKIQMSIFLDGTIAIIIRNITMSDVPTDVTGLLDKYVPDAKVTNVNLAEGGNGLKRYEFQGSLNGIDLNIEIAANANQISIIESKRR